MNFELNEEQQQLADSLKQPLLAHDDVDCVPVALGPQVFAGHDRGHGRPLQAAQRRMGEHAPADGLGRLAAHVGRDEVGAAGPQVGLDVLQQVAGHGQRPRPLPQGRPIGDEHRLRAQDDAAGQRPQVVVAQRNAGGHQIADQVRIPQGRGDLQRALDGHQVVGLNVVVVEEAGRQAGELGGHAQRPPGRGQFGRPAGQISHVPHGRVLRRGQVQRAWPEAQRVVDGQHRRVSRAPLLGQHVVAGDAELDAALLDAGHDVARPLEDDGHVGQGRDRGRVLAWVGPEDAQAARLQELQRPILQNALAR